MDQESRMERGYKILREVDGGAGEEVTNSLDEISPDLSRYIVEYAFGDIYSRSGLDLKSTEIAVVAALTAVGNAVPQLKVHLNGALNVGCTINEIKDVILQMSSYSGFPTCINAMNTFRAVLTERQNQGYEDCLGEESTNKKLDNTEKYEVGVKELSKLDPMQVEKLEKEYKDFCPDLVYLVINSYAEVFSRNTLDIKYRQIATIAALAALGNAQAQLTFHINAGLNIGITADEIKEIMILLTVFSGFPSAINGINVLREVTKC